MPSTSWETFKESQFTTSQIKRLDEDLILSTKDYFEAVKSFCHPDKELLKTLVVLGLSGETSELFQEIEKAISATLHRLDLSRGTFHCHLNVEKIFDETSDCLWYIFAIIYAFDLNLELFFTDSFRWEGMESKGSSIVLTKIIENLNYSANMGELQKKVLGHGKSFADIGVDFARNLFFYRFNLQTIAYNMGFTLEDCAKHNLDKLKQRHPKGFMEKS